MVSEEAELRESQEQPSGTSSQQQGSGRNERTNVVNGLGGDPPDLRR